MLGVHARAKFRLHAARAEMLDVFLHDAGVHHDLQPRLAGGFGRFVIDHPFLHPYKAGADGNRAADDLGNKFRPPENVDRIDGERNVLEPGICLFA